MLYSKYWDYKETYSKRLSSYKNAYDDNTEVSFLERDLIIYANYCNVIVNIANIFIGEEREDLTKNESLARLLYDLKELNEPVFKEIFSSYLPLIKGDQEILDNRIEDEMIIGYILPPSDEIIKKLRNYVTSARRILDFIEKRLSSDDSVVNVEEYHDSKQIDNPYPQIFKNVQSYQLFQKLFEKYKTSQYKLADFSFIYRKMYKDGYILDSFKPQMFINWLSKEPYRINLDKIKTMSNCSTPGKIQIYDTIKEVLQM